MSDNMLTYVKESKQVLNSILKSRETILDEALSFIKESEIKHVYVVGSGTSYHASLTVKKMFEDLVGIPYRTMYAFQFIDDETMIPDNCLVIGISQSGGSISTKDALIKAKEMGAFTLSIVGEDDTEVEKYSDVNLYVPIGEEISVAKTKGYLATVLTLMLLAIENTIKPLETEVKLNLYLRFNNTIQGLDDIIDESETWVKDNLPRLVSAKSVFVVGYANHFGTALEGALKLLETVRIPVTGYEMEEFMHGIYNAVNKDSFLIHISALGKYFERSEMMRDYFDDITDNNVVIKQGVSSSNVIGCDFKDDEYFSVLEYIIPLQIMAYYTSNAKGIDANHASDPKFHYKMGSKKLKKDLI